MVVGVEDVPCPLPHSRALADALPTKELTVFPGVVGHVVHLERRAEVSRILLPVVDRATTGAPRTFATAPG